MDISFDFAVSEIIRAGNRLDRLGLAPATSGNYSMRLSDGTMAITVSGAHKGQLEPEKIMRATLEGVAIDDKKPSDETLLHVGLYKAFPHVNAILHTHSVPCVVLSRKMKNAQYLELEGYEMLKAFPNVKTHETTVRLPIFENTQDIVELSTRVDPVLKSSPHTPAYLIRGHGLYGWGRDMREAERVIEAAEILLECELRMLQIA